MPLVIGTAGHIDHGKTALVRALTGQDTDRLKEEKERGISIDLGFAYLDGIGTTRVGIVDVPGHERFIRNMLAGAHGIDLVLFTIAADDGVMPQSEEHLDILHLLGVSRGVFVITKADLVDAARLAAVREEIEILTLDTTLEGAPIVAVSSVTGAGLDALRAEIAAQLSAPGDVSADGDVPADGDVSADGVFRLPVDRAFVMRGHGTVVTGTAVAGVVRDGDVLRVLPGGETVRVRGLEVHGTAVAEARAGQRVAMNLAGIERETLGRGHVVCDQTLTRTSDRLDAWVEIRPAAKKAVRSHQRVRVHLGTADVLGKLIVLGGDGAIAPRAHGWAQLVLREPVLALRGDRFVLRDETARWTIGGGVVVHPFPDRRRAADAGLAAGLERLRSGTPAEAATTFVETSAGFAVDLETLAHGLNLGVDTVRRVLRDAPGVLAIPEPKAPDAYTTSAKWDALERHVLEALARLHREQPLAEGLEMESLRSGLPWELPARQFRWCIERLTAAKRLVRTDSTVRRPDHRVQLDDQARALGERLERALADGGLMPPDLRQLESALGVARGMLTTTLGVLEKERRVVRVSADLYYAPAAVDDARRRIAEHCRLHGGITAAEFRDLIGASRKFAVAFLEWCDRTGVTLRVGDVHKLRAG